MTIFLTDLLHWQTCVFPGAATLIPPEIPPFPLPTMPSQNTQLLSSFVSDQTGQINRSDVTGKFPVFPHRKSSHTERSSPPRC